MFAATPGTRRWLLALAGWLAAAAPAPADHGVKDEAGVFSPAARAEADKKIDDLYRHTHKDLLIVVLPRLPDEQARQYRDHLPGRNRSRFFENLARDRAREAGVDGVYVLLCTHPPAHAVVVWPEANDALFPLNDREKLDRIFGNIKAEQGFFSSLFRKKREPNDDKALTEALDFTEQALRANLRAQAGAPADAVRWTAVLWPAAGLLLAWGLLGLLRARVAARQGTVAAPLPLGTGLLGGMIGSSAGLWVYETYFAHRDGRAPAPPPAGEPVAGEPPPAEEGPPPPEPGAWTDEGRESALRSEHP
jgi:hypothetical protein